MSDSPFASSGFAFKASFAEKDPHDTSADPSDPTTSAPSSAKPADSADPADTAPGSLFRKSVFSSLNSAQESSNSAAAAAAAGIPKFVPNRRTSVSAESMNPSALAKEWKPPNKTLTPEQLSQLKADVSKNFLFKSLDEESMKRVLYSLEEKKVPAGENIITQGDEGDFFYVIRSGTVDFYVDGKKVSSAGPGGSFGELALMYNAPRAATVTAVTDCELLALDRVTFRSILLDGTFKKRAMYESFLSDVSVLKDLNSYERSKLADALVSESFKPGDVIVREGDVGENFYLIESGTAKVTKESTGSEPIAILKKGDYFGEVALLNDLPRQATVTALEPLKVATLDKSGFQRLLGPAVEILKRQDPTHKKE